jgi:hypothetical protein
MVNVEAGSKTRVVKFYVQKFLKLEILGLNNFYMPFCAVDNFVYWTMVRNFTNGKINV